MVGYEGFSKTKQANEPYSRCTRALTGWCGCKVLIAGGQTRDHLASPSKFVAALRLLKDQERPSG